MKRYLKIFSPVMREAKKKEKKEEELEVVLHLDIHQAHLFPISWIFCPSLEAVKDVIEEHGADAGSALPKNDVPAFIIPLESDNDIRCVVYITPNHNNKVSDLVALIAHEANHVVMEGLKFIGEDEPSIELLAYFQQYVTQSIISDYFDFHNIKDELVNG